MMTGVMRTWARFEQGILSIGGELAQDNVAAFEQELDQFSLLPAELLVDLGAFDIADGVATVAAVNAMRRLASGRHLIIKAAPQLLAHNLYRVAALEDGAITLAETREDEPYG